MSIIVSHPTGNANVRAAASGIEKEGLLYEFNTSIASFPGSLLDRLGAFGPFSEIRRRRYEAALSPYTRMSPWRELGRLLATRAGLSSLVKHETGAFCIDAVYRGLDQSVALELRNSSLQGAKGIYAYEDGASSSFLEAKKYRIRCLYDLPTGYWRAKENLLEIERERWPDWISTMTSFNDSSEKLKRKDIELQLADRIMVASQFVAETLKEYPGQLAPIEVIPYGFPPVVSERKYLKNKVGQPLKILFVGKLTQQKGIADLFAVAKKLRKHIELTVVGHKATDKCPALEIELVKHRWIPSLPHHKILELMRDHDILVFPSLFDGFGLVITEAMSQGTPVVTTNRTAGPDLIKHGIDGWVVEAGSTSALLLAIEHIIDSPELISQAGHAAMETAKRRQWQVYQQELSDVIKKDLKLS